LEFGVSVQVELLLYDCAPHESRLCGDSLMKILVISMAGIGDTLLATPLIAELRANFPAAQIDTLVMWSGSKDLLQGNPHLNSIFQKNLLNVSKVSALRFLHPLRRAVYDVSVNTHPQSRFLIIAAGQ